MTRRAAAAPPPGRLRPCPDRPNCVCSRAADPRRRVAPIGYPGERAQALTVLLAAIRALPRTQVLRVEDGYVHAVQRSRLCGFVDDLECELPEGERLIHLRSASRSGYYDFGVNRARVDRLRRAVNERLAGEG